MIQRVDNWTKHLNEYIEEVRFRPFEWGVHDCGIFACSAYERLTGVNVLIKDVSFPRNSLLAYTRLEAANPDGITGLCLPMFGVPIDGWKSARRGDIVVIASDKLTGVKEALGVALGNNVAALGLDGLVFVSLQLIKKVWRIGP